MRRAASKPARVLPLQPPPAGDLTDAQLEARALELPVRRRDPRDDVELAEALAMPWATEEPRAPRRPAPQRSRLIRRRAVAAMERRLPRTTERRRDPGGGLRTVITGKEQCSRCGKWLVPLTEKVRARDVLMRTRPEGAKDWQDDAEHGPPGTRRHKCDPCPPDILFEILQLADVPATLEMIEGWDINQRNEAQRWAGKYILSASDNACRVPPRPAFLPKRTTAPAPAPRGGGP